MQNFISLYYSDCYFVVDPDEGVMDNAENVRDVGFVLIDF